MKKFSLEITTENGAKKAYITKDLYNEMRSDFLSEVNFVRLQLKIERLKRELQVHLLELEMYKCCN